MDMDMDIYSNVERREEEEDITYGILGWIITSCSIFLFGTILYSMFNVLLLIWHQQL